MTREEALEILKKYKDESEEDYYVKRAEALEIAIEALENQKTGYWISHPRGRYAHLICYKCLSNAPYDCRTNFCPNCGAKMEGV